eukprot:7230070-Prymnesium_polylepis.4
MRALCCGTDVHDRRTLRGRGTRRFSADQAVADGSDLHAHVTWSASAREWVCGSHCNTSKNGAWLKRSHF